jgi:predicted RNA-binding Zn-ribbon protein involved in translation (DUF1610 family)
MKKITKIGDEYEVHVTQFRLCKHCGQIIIIHKDTVKIYCPDCKKFTDITPKQ